MQTSPKIAYVIKAGSLTVIKTWVFPVINKSKTLTMFECANRSVCCISFHRHSMENRNPKSPKLTFLLWEICVNAGVGCVAQKLRYVSFYFLGGKTCLWYGQGKIINILQNQLVVLSTALYLLVNWPKKCLEKI